MDLNGAEQSVSPLVEMLRGGAVSKQQPSALEEKPQDISTDSQQWDEDTSLPNFSVMEEMFARMLTSVTLCVQQQQQFIQQQQATMKHQQQILQIPTNCW